MTKYSDEVIARAENALSQEEPFVVFEIANALASTNYIRSISEAEDNQEFARLAQMFHDIANYVEENYM